MKVFSPLKNQHKNLVFMHADIFFGDYYLIKYVWSNI